MNVTCPAMLSIHEQTDRVPPKSCSIRVFYASQRTRANCVADRRALRWGCFTVKPLLD